MNDRGGRRLFRRRSEPSGPPGVYLDGGFGVGKTHLLASLWHEAPAPKAFGTFVGYTHLVGALGFADAVAALSTRSLVCIDEFELDDPGDTRADVDAARAAGRGAASGSRRRPTRCPAPSARAASRPTTSCARSRRCRPTSRSCGSTATTTATGGCPRRRQPLVGRRRRGAWADAQPERHLRRLRRPLRAPGSGPPQPVRRARRRTQRRGRHRRPPARRPERRAAAGLARRPAVRP